MRVFAATKNLHKISEFEEILSPLGFSVKSAFDSNDLLELQEDGETFEANAISKAESVASALNKRVFADDSGLEVEALDGEPGIYSARYAGENATDKDRINKLLERLADQPNRRARFVCVIAVASPAVLLGTASGVVNGTIAISPKGQEGFGYDPVFIPQGYEHTWAELGPKKKNKMSHRLKALNDAVKSGLFAAE